VPEMSIMVEVVGWTGAAAVLGAYLLLAMKKLGSDTYTYHGLNILGAFLLSFYAYWKDASASLVINVIWCFIGLTAIMAIYRAGSKLSKS